ncbi:hypothetical protein [Streptomyces sp. NPDC088726]|uniref:hypothetical protein n=1 Tax=Streptomyces sp. NPDC088726 TaxID=3365874 RepID=UPI0037F2F8C5
MTWAGLPAHQVAHGSGVVPLLGPRVGQGGDWHPAEQLAGHALVDAGGTELDMGTRVNTNPEESNGACYTAAASIPPARANRTLLTEALSAAGLVN